MMCRWLAGRDHVEHCVAALPFHGAHDKEDRMPGFAGTWNTTRYSANDPENPESIQLTVAVDSGDPNSVDGHYERPGPDATLFGSREGNGSVWRATLAEPHTGDSGTAVFFLSTDGNTIHGAWQSGSHNNGPQPWFGTRA